MVRYAFKCGISSSSCHIETWTTLSIATHSSVSYVNCWKTKILLVYNLQNSKNLWLIIKMLDALTIRPPTNRHATIQPKWSVHPTNRLLWQFTTVTFHLNVDELSVHPKLWHSDLENLDSLSQCDKNRPTVIIYSKVSDILSPYFLSNFAVTFCPSVIIGAFFPVNLVLFSHFYLFSY